jgi:hypothetical protein
MVEILWQDPPPKVDSRHAATLAALKANPGRWALLLADRTSSTAGTAWKKLGCEVEVSRKNPGETPPKYDVYARWPDSPAPKPAPLARPAGPDSLRAGPGTYDPLGRDRRGVPSDGLPVASLQR